jgi:hypothetical protein
MKRILKIPLKGRWNAKLFSASSEIPDFLSKGRRRNLVHKELPVPAGHPGLLNRSGSRSRCSRGRDEIWLSIIGASDNGMDEPGSSDCDPEKKEGSEHGFVPYAY